MRQALKALSDDTRLRIINILFHNSLTVNQICSVLYCKQPAVSKHLVRLRLLGIVSDKRRGTFIYYSLNRYVEPFEIIKFLIKRFNNLEIFNQDLEKIKQIKKGSQYDRTAED